MIETGLDWTAIGTTLSDRGFAKLPELLSARECSMLVGLYDDDTLFRSRVEMRKHNFGEGDYKYFADPLPPAVRRLRETLYTPLAGIVNGWMEQLGDATRFPAELNDFTAQCHRAGQTKPTPLMLHYEAGGYNCLHQDIYGDVVFPLQVVVMLSELGREYDGGELLFVEQRPRSQSVGNVVTAQRGEAVIFTTRFRPVRGSRGFYRATMRHGVSRLHSGRRFSLGIIFHDAR